MLFLIYHFHTKVSNLLLVIILFYFEEKSSFFINLITTYLFMISLCLIMSFNSVSNSTQIPDIIIIDHHINHLNSNYCYHPF